MKDSQYSTELDEKCFLCTSTTCRGCVIWEEIFGKDDGLDCKDDGLDYKYEEFDHKEKSTFSTVYDKITGTYSSHRFSGGTYTNCIVSKCNHAVWLEIPHSSGSSIKVFLASYAPVVPDEVDVFIDLTTNDPPMPYIPKWMKKHLPKLQVPEYLVSWNVTDGSVGSSRLIDFILNMIGAGLTVGWGCMGGHGRTGWVACRIIKALTGWSGDQALRYLRENYCEKAVETPKQAQDLGLVEEKPYYTTTYSTSKGGKV